MGVGCRIAQGRVMSRGRVGGGRIAQGRVGVGGMQTISVCSDLFSCNSNSKSPPVPSSVCLYPLCIFPVIWRFRRLRSM